MNSVEHARFEATVLRHIDAAHNLARHLVGNADDAEDVVQEAFLRAIRYFATFDGREPRAWLLRITRNVSYDLLQRSRAEQFVALDDADESDSALIATDDAQHFQRALDWSRIENALAALPTEFREVIVLRELEGLSYAEISQTTGVAAGTVMSRLSRARRRLRVLLGADASGDAA